MNGSVSWGSFRVFNLYSDTSAIAANHLKVESRVHSETSEIEIAILPTISLPSVFCRKDSRKRYLLKQGQNLDIEAKMQIDAYGVVAGSPLKQPRYLRSIFEQKQPLYGQRLGKGQRGQPYVCFAEGAARVADAGPSLQQSMQWKNPPVEPAGFPS